MWGREENGGVVWCGRIHVGIIPEMRGRDGVIRIVFRDLHLYPRKGKSGLGGWGPWRDLHPLPNTRGTGTV